MTRPSFSLTAAQLRLLALTLMLLDHLGRTVFPGQTWMICLGRLAFPIFAFQTAEGYQHTHNFRGYCGRLFLFGLISELPFNLMLSGSPFYPAHQNVLFTLLLGLLACRAWDRQAWWQMALVCLAGALTFPDYGALGVASVLMFHVLRSNRPAQLLFLVLVNVLGYGGPSIQSLAALAWLPISLYRGEKGRGGRALQYSSYVFYPLHMLILGLL